MRAEQISIVEDEAAVWLHRGRSRVQIAASKNQSRVRLPSFDGHPRASILKVLHQEILVNIIDGRPVPNFLVYSRPWYRDGAMMAMVLDRTGNLDLIKDWILGLREPYDRNNAGEREADNPGEALYLVSRVSDRSHPLVPVLLRELERLEKDGHIEGRSDFSTHPVYQTIWANFGLSSLGMPARYKVPPTSDSYRDLCWWTRDKEVIRGARQVHTDLDYPYLTWARTHFTSKALGPVSDGDYPLTWEAKASQANYEGMSRIDERFTREQDLCSAHVARSRDVPGDSRSDDDEGETARESVR